MKLLFKIIRILILVGFTIPMQANCTNTNIKSINHTENILQLSATISGTSNVCQYNTTSQITFTGSGGSAPYTFNYTINGVNQPAITTLGLNNAISISVNTLIVGTFNYNLISVVDSTNITQLQAGIATVVISPSPNVSIGGTGLSIVDGVQVFKICINSNSTFTFTNTSSTTASNINYTINWGDGSPNYVSTSWTSTSHTYPIGLWNLVYTIDGNNGCSTTKNYTVFVGSNPAVSLGNPGNTDICINDSITFPITGTSNNPPGTTYTVTFNDGSPPEIFNHPPPATITHTFIIPSCGTTSSDGSNSYPNSFQVNIVATNPCSSSSVGVVPIYVSSLPIANFSGPPIGCINSQICFTNTSEGFQVIGSICYEPKKVWSISPATGYTIVNGSFLGNDFSSTDASLWQSGSDNLCVIFTVSGTYTITIKSGSKCGLNDFIDIETKTICIEPQLFPLFTASVLEGCSPLNVTITNTTNLINQCTPTNFLWSVTYNSGNCGNNSVYTYTNGTSANSIEPSFNFTGAGTYTITLSTTNSCGTKTISRTIKVKKPPRVTIDSISNRCKTTNPVLINPTANINNCTPNSNLVSYQWSFPGGTPSSSTNQNPGSISYNSEGNFIVSLSVTNDCGTTIASNELFTIFPMPVITGPLVTCVNSSSQLISSNSGNGNSWSASPTGIVTINNNGLVTGVSAGTTTITFTDSNGCTASKVFVVKPLPLAMITGTATVCQNSNTQITFNGTNGTSPYTFTYTINNGPNLTISTTNGNSVVLTVPTSVAGIFTYNLVTVQDSSQGSCINSQTSTVTVTVNEQPTIVVQPIATQSICLGGTIAPISVTYIGGTGTVSYQWYSNTINSTTGGIAISGANAASYAPTVFTSIGTFYYYAVVTLSGSGCNSVSSNSTAIIVQPDPIITSQPLASQTQCQNSNPIPLTVISTGGLGIFSYQWYSNSINSSIGGTLISGATTTTYLPSTNTIGTNYYYCVISQTGLGCSVVSETAIVTINLAPIFILQPVSSTICLGGTPTLLSFSYSNGVGTPSYQWFSNTTNANTGGIPILGATNPNYTPINSTTGVLYYYCEIYFPSFVACSTIVSNQASVTINELAIITLQPATIQTLCVGSTILSPLNINLSGTTGNATYQWYFNTINATIGGTLIPGATNSDYLPPVYSIPGNYFYFAIVTFNVSGCGPITSEVAQIVIVADPNFTLQPLSSQTICQNSNLPPLFVSVSGGIGVSYSYQWYSNVVNNTSTGTILVGETSSSYTPLTALIGTTYYYCIVSQSIGLGCSVTSSTASITINLNPTQVTQPMSNTICIGQTPIPLSVSFINGVGTPQYQWYSNTVNSTIGSVLISQATNSTYIPSSTTFGTTYYYCIITFPSGGCLNLTSNLAEINVNGSTLIAPISQMICTYNTFSVTPNNSNGNIVPMGTTFTWSTPTIFPTGSVLGATAQSIPQTEISQTLTSTITTPSTVVYTITPLSGDCIGANFTITITVIPSINTVATITNSNCFASNNGEITTNITGGNPFINSVPYSVSWTGPNGFTSSLPSISELEPGVYTITVTDNGGCPYSNSYTITQPTELILITDLEKDITCFGDSNGQISISVNGGTGLYTYTWTKNNLPFSNNQDITNLDPGIYMVSVTDANSCGPITATFTINQPTVLAVNLVSQTNIFCFGLATGAISILANGGTPTQVSSTIFSYNYSWTGPNGFISTNQNISNLFPGTYNLVVSDSLGCSKSLSVSITQSTPIVITTSVTPVTCYQANNGTVSVSVSGGNPSFQYTWSNLATNLNQTNLSSGNYTLTVIDASGCQKSVTVYIPDAPIFTVNSTMNSISCFGANNGSINLSLTGGIAPISYSWSDGSSLGLTRNNLGPGIYSVTIVDASLCTINRTFTILEPQQLVISANITNATDCNNANSGGINLIVSGGTPPFIYSWSNGITTEDLTNVSAGNYNVTVTDSKGCVKTGQYIISRQSPIVLNVTTTTNVNCSESSISQIFEAQVTGGFPPFQFNWSSGVVSGINNNTMTTNQNGLVVLQAIDALGCVGNYTYNVVLPTSTLGSASFDYNSIGYSTYGEYTILDPIQFTNTATGNFISVSWDFGDGTFSNVENPIHVYQNEGSYVVTQTIFYDYGCVSTMIITLIIKKGYLLIVPNAFTPNGDAINDTFRPVTKALNDVQMDVYDTWGSLIYSEKGDVLRGWNAEIKGVNAENGNYYCKVRGTTFYGIVVNENQPFVLIK